MPDGKSDGPATRRSPQARLLLAAFALSGAAALIYEVAWTRALSLVIGSTTYAVSTMLATFMAGLAIGAAVGGRLADRSENRIALFALCELGIGIAGIASIPLIYVLPRVYLALYRLTHLHPTLFFAMQIVLCAAIMLIPTVLMGATFPIVSRAVSERYEQMGRDVGAAYSLNTVGAVIGSLLAGFLLIPWIGLRATAIVAGVVNLAVGTTLLIRSGRRSGRLLGGAAVLSLAVVAIAATSSGHFGTLNYYSAHRHTGDVPYWMIRADAERNLELLVDKNYAEGRLRAYRTPDKHLLLQVGGKMEGTAATDVANTLLLAYLPAASRPARETALVIGLGAGVTLGAAKDVVAGDVDVVEIHPGVVDVVEQFGPPEVLRGVEVAVDDARSFLLRSKKRWDVIFSGPSYPSESMVGNLFTREFYELAADHMTADGVFSQWLPYYILSNQDIGMMLRTFSRVFPHVFLWKIPNSLELILVGSREPFDASPEQIQERVSRFNRGRWPLEFVLSRRPDEVAAEVLGSSGPINTDDRPILEFRTAHNLLIGDLARID